MEAGQQEHRNKDEYRGDQKKVGCLRHHIGENRVLGHDRPPEILSVMMSSMDRGAEGRIYERYNQLINDISAIMIGVDRRSMGRVFLRDENLQPSEQFYTDLFRRRT
jgi:hypothetical protein